MSVFWYRISIYAVKLSPVFQALYNGLSQFHQSKVCNAAKAVGEEISRLQYAQVDRC